MYVPICELGQPGLFPQPFMPRAILPCLGWSGHWTLFFWHGVVHTSTRTCSPDRFFVCFPPEKCDRFNDPGKTKRQQTSEKKLAYVRTDMRAGPARSLPQPFMPRAILHVWTDLDIIFLTRRCSYINKHMQSRPFFCLFSAREMWPI